MEDTNTPTQEQQPTKHLVHTPLLIMVQLIICIAVIIGAFVVKNIGGTVYATVSTWFFDNYNNSIFINTADSPLKFLDPSTIAETSRHSSPFTPPPVEESKP